MKLCAQCLNLGQETARQFPRAKPWDGRGRRLIGCQDRHNSSELGPYYLPPLPSRCSKSLFWRAGIAVPTGVEGGHSGFLAEATKRDRERKPRLRCQKPVPSWPVRFTLASVAESPCPRSHPRWREGRVRRRRREAGTSAHVLLQRSCFPYARLVLGQRTACVAPRVPGCHPQRDS